MTPEQIEQELREAARPNSRPVDMTPSFLRWTLRLFAAAIVLVFVAIGTVYFGTAAKIEDSTDATIENRQVGFDLLILSCQGVQLASDGTIALPPSCSRPEVRDQLRHLQETAPTEGK